MLMAPCLLGAVDELAGESFDSLMSLETAGGAVSLRVFQDAVRPEPGEVLLDVPGVERPGVARDLILDPQPVFDGDVIEIRNLGETYWCHQVDPSSVGGRRRHRVVAGNFVFVIDRNQRRRDLGADAGGLGTSGAEPTSAGRVERGGNFPG